MEPTATEGAVEGTAIAPDESVEIESTIDPAEGSESTSEIEAGAEGTEGEVEEARYVLTIDGVETEVSETELKEGFLRQADYTRKTQAVATEREQLATLRALEQALTSDPTSAVKALAEAYGISLAADSQLEEMDPLERQVAELTQRLQSQEQANRQAAITAEATRAIEAHGLADTTEQELLQFAMQGQIGNLNTAALLMQVQREKATEKKATIVKRTESKRTAAVVDGGRQKSAAATQPIRPKTIAESFALAKTQLGL